MAENTKIEWAHPPGYRGETWNPTRGCSRVSKGCEHCYAEGVAHRYGGPGMPYEGLTVLGNNGPRWNGNITLAEGRLQDPLRKKKPRCYFVNSMSDLFHEKIPFDYIDKVFAVMALCPQHIFQVLTKRPERMREYIKGLGDSIKTFEVKHIVERGGIAQKKQKHEMPLPNVWLGVSAEDQETADARIPILLQTPAAIRWVSLEPLLGPITLVDIHYEDMTAINALNGKHGFPTPHAEGNSKLDWVVVGGESGYGARPMHPDWARTLRSQCRKEDIPFFFKQWGEYEPLPVPENERVCVSCGCSDRRPCIRDEGPCHWLPRMKVAPDDRCNYCLGKSNKLHRFKDGTPMLRVGKAAAGHYLDDLTHQEYPEVKR